MTNKFKLYNFYCFVFIGGNCWLFVPVRQGFINFFSPYSPCFLYLLTLSSGNGSYSFDVSGDGGTPESIGNNSTFIIKGADTTIFTQLSSPDTLTIKANTTTIATVSHVASRTVNDLSDTTIASEADNDILAYDSGTNEWINFVVIIFLYVLTVKNFS